MLGGVESGIVLIVALLWIVVLVCLGPWLSSNDLKVLLSGIAVAAFIVLIVLHLTTLIHSLSLCSLLFPCPRAVNHWCLPSYPLSLPWLCASAICLPFSFQTHAL